ncbi:unnamed protein product [Orchesella dallaii]|uniref:Uncharacterized protein n=1 Tax=Orchesella dallaii TaxID=48710 RepID=A0ABP1RZI6_9HEXA
MAYLMSLAMLFICGYKAYEVTIIVFYLSDQSQLVDKEDAEIHDLHQHEYERRHSDPIPQPQPPLPPSSYTTGPDTSRPTTAKTYTTAETDEYQKKDEPKRAPYGDNFKKYVEGTSFP